jgi:hypothetical protein
MACGYLFEAKSLKFQGLTIKNGKNSKLLIHNILRFIVIGKTWMRGDLFPEKKICRAK